MSNELKLSADINVITAEINSYKQVAGQAIFEIGRRLKYVKENDLAYGEWAQWIENNLSITYRQANKYIKVYEEFKSDMKSSSYLGLDALYLMATLPEEEREKTHTIPSTGEQKNVDEMTVRELREVKKALKEKEEKVSQLEIDLQKEKNKPQQVKEVIVEKVVDNTDYASIEKLTKEIKNKEDRLSGIERQKQLLEQRLKQEEKDVAEYNKVKEELKRLHSEKDDLHRQIESATALSGLYVEIEHFLQTKLAPVKYSRALTERRDSKVAMENLEGIIDMVEVWLNEMKGYLPRDRQSVNNIIDAEVIDYE